MALSTYTNISAKVEEWLNRQNASFMSTNVEDFIILAQRRIQRDIRVPPMEKKQELTITSGQASVPSAMLDVKEMIGFDGNTAWDIRRTPYSVVRTERQKGGTGPLYFDTVGGNFEFGPEPSSGVSVEVVYYQELNFIDTSNESNWFSTYAPELILYGALAEAAVFIRDPELEAVYDKKFNQAKGQLELQKRKAEYSGRVQVQNR